MPPQPSANSHTSGKFRSLLTFQFSCLGFRTGSTKKRVSKGDNPLIFPFADVGQVWANSQCDISTDLLPNPALKEYHVFSAMTSLFLVSVISTVIPATH